jgi:hypothetical protein
MTESPEYDWQERRDMDRRRSSGGISTGWLVAGLAVVGLGALAWYYLGPDLRRYLKIRSM